MSSAAAYIGPLGQLKDNILLLTIASAHICEETTLVKIGKSMDDIVPSLREGISALKKEYPGKFRQEFDTDDLIDNIQAIAKTMQKPGTELVQKCVIGELARMLESDFNSIRAAIKFIRAQVEGKGHSYSKKDQISDIGHNLGNLWGAMGGFFLRAIKIISCVIIIGILGFFYLFLTMDKEESLREEINASKALIREQQELLSRLEIDRQQLLGDIEDIEKGNLKRQEKISILDLEMKVHQIEEKQQKAYTKIKSHEELIAGNEEIIREIKTKSFFKRLLRQ